MNKRLLHQMVSALIVGGTGLTIACSPDTPTSVLQHSGTPASVVIVVPPPPPPPPPPTGNEGCSPGYWKQSQHAANWLTYSPADGFNATFGISTGWFKDDVTLLDALQFRGGGALALARQATGALLNASQGFYPMTAADVIAGVQSVYPDGDIEGMKNLFAGFNNNLVCPLN